MSEEQEKHNRETGQESGEVKVVDRRSQQSEASPPKETPRAGVQESDEGSLPPVDFPSFIVGLATQAMMLLGEIPDPQTGTKLAVNLQHARQTIDIISLLKEKTSGNLSPDEEKLMQDVITTLRLSFVKKAKS